MKSFAKNNGALTIRLGTDADRQAIYAMRHAVYATELGQHVENEQRELTDSLDEFNVYIVATRGGQMAGFVSITPPGFGRYSIDKYVSRDELPFACDGKVFEVRILTVAKPYRGTPVGGLLMYAASRWIESQGGSASWRSGGGKSSASISKRDWNCWGARFSQARSPLN